MNAPPLPLKVYRPHVWFRTVDLQRSLVCFETVTKPPSITADLCSKLLTTRVPHVSTRPRCVSLPLLSYSSRVLVLLAMHQVVFTLTHILWY